MLRNPPPPNAFTSALDAIGNLCDEALSRLDSGATTILISAHSEIKGTEVRHKNAVFFRNYFPLRNQLITALADHYRRLFKLALAHPRQTENDPDRWVTIQIQPALNVGFEWIREWYILACEGENQSVRLLATQEVVQAGTISIPIPTTASQLPAVVSWRAPAWLFGVSLTFFGIGQMKQQHIPQTSNIKRTRKQRA